MKYYLRISIFCIVIVSAIVTLVIFFRTHTISLFDPQGTIALQERNLIIAAVLIMLVVAIPMLIALYTFAWRYRAGNKKVKRDPERVGGVIGQLAWWIIPAIIVVTLSILNWKATHALYPSDPLVSTIPPLTIQVVALDWKWLFIYPAQGIATVNFIQFPAGTPIHFELTADGPMNSFWIPQLGGQEYAMAGMVNQLNLMANAPGQFVGKATEINGAGYSGMTFIAKASSESDFDAWVASVQQSPLVLDTNAYNALAAPSQNNAPAYYSSVDRTLYGTVMMKYMMPSGDDAATSSEMPGIPDSMTTSSMPTPQTQGNTMPGMQM